jgi:hypothetical protein
MPYPMIDDDESGENYKRALIQQLNAPQPEQQPGMTDNAFLSSLSQSAAQLGTLGGKTADTSSVQKYADILDQRKQMQAQSQQAQMAKRQDILAKLAMMQDSQGLKRDQLAQAEKTKKDAQDFELTRDKNKYKFEKDLANSKAERAYEIAQAKADAKADATKDKPPSERQSMTAYNASRAKSALIELDEIDQSGYEPSSYGATFRKLKLPGIGQVAANSNDRRYEKAGRAFLASILRPESGGAITDQEWSDYGPIYLPQPGDDQATISSKRASRKQALDSLIAGAGPGYDPRKIKTWRDYENEYNDKNPSDSSRGPAPDGLVAAPAPKGMKGMPGVGDVIKGYRFKGGDPGVKANWEKE